MKSGTGSTTTTSWAVAWPLLRTRAEQTISSPGAATRTASSEATVSGLSSTGALWATRRTTFEPMTSVSLATSAAWRSKIAPFSTVEVST